jgi:phosphoribosylformylglycinamidine cyclo-ligase
MYDVTKPYKTQILEMIRTTWADARYTEAVLDVQALCQPYPLHVPVYLASMCLDHMDGIGTKGLFHWERRTFRQAAQDAFAMNLNDLAVSRAEPVKMLDHIVLPEDDHEAVLMVVDELARLCREYRLALVGGETSVQDTMRGMDVTVAMSGVCRKNYGNAFRPGDALVGIASSGLHSNGFTKVRQVLGDIFRPEYVVPTRLYWRQAQEACKGDVRGMCHVTGGAFTKLLPYLPNATARITRKHGLLPQAIFRELHAEGVTDAEMYKTFNCGVGYILGVPTKRAGDICRLVGGEVIGEVTKGERSVVIDSMFSGESVTYV